MYFTDEKDYIMRMIKEIVSILFTLAFGKKYVSVELEKVNKYEVSGKNLKDFLNMIDAGQINEAAMSLCLYMENLKKIRAKELLPLSYSVE